MPTYKLMYFEVKGRAEVIRMALTVAGQEFEDKRFAWEEWQTVKPTMPQNQLPCLQVDDRLIPQSGAILRFVGRAFGLYGENNDESTTIDVVIGATEDFKQPTTAMRYEKDEAKKAEMIKDLQNVKLPAYLNILEDILKQNDGGDGFFAGKKISIADLMVFDLMDQLGTTLTLPPFPPKLAGLMERVKSNSKLKEYLAKRGN